MQNENVDPHSEIIQDFKMVTAEHSANYGNLLGVGHGGWPCPVATGTGQ
jgi:hypothetical protein